MVRFTLLVLILSLGSLLGPIVTWAQNGALVGRVLDEHGAPIQCARVMVKGTQLSVQSNARGEYRILVPVGGYSVLARAMGCMPLEHTVQIGSVEEATINFRMTPRRAPIDSSQSKQNPWPAPCPAPAFDLHDWSRVELQVFSVAIPLDYHQVEVQGRDSYVGSFQACDSTAILSFDAGGFSDPLTRKEGFVHFSACTEMIGGKQARLITAERPVGGTNSRGFRYVAGAAFRDIKPNVHVTFWGEAETLRGLETLLSAMRTVHFEN